MYYYSGMWFAIILALPFLWIHAGRGLRALILLLFSACASSVAAIMLGCLNGNPIVYHLTLGCAIVSWALILFVALPRIASAIWNAP